MARFEKLHVFTVRDLRARSRELLRNAENGCSALITKHCRPVMVAVPFDERLRKHGVARALALDLFEAGRVTLSQAAKLAEMSAEEFIDLLGTAGVDAVSYPRDDLEVEAVSRRLT